MKNSTQSQKENPKSAPPANIQRQDTDYDVSPAIKKTRPDGR